MPGRRLPYPGLRAFTRDESDLFFGREGCVDSMVDRLSTTRFLAVLGSSGSGKSSLVRTGLLDALDLGLHPWAGSRWRVADLHPGGQPLRNLATALLETSGSVPDSTDVDLLTTFLRQGPRAIVEWVEGGNLRTNTNILILVDQFEELFRYGDYAQREEAEAFVAMLLESAGTTGVAIHVVLTMRSEYLGACALISGLAERINAGLYLTPRMGREECRAAIEGPASVTGFKVEPALVNRLLNDLETFAPWEAGREADQLQRLSRRADQLPLMQHVLNRLWDLHCSAHDSVTELSLGDYERIGGLSGALDAHGAEVMDGLGAERRDLVEGVFRALVSGGSVAQAVRRPCRLREVVHLSNASRDDVVAVVDAFSAPDCNFIRVSERLNGAGDVIVDISHESLIRQWTPLATWLEKETRATSNWDHLLWAADRHARGEGNLLSGLDLANFMAWWEAERPTAAWATRHGGQFERVSAFLTESHAAALALSTAERDRNLRERNQLRRQRAGLAIALTTVAGFGAFSVVEWRTAAVQEGRAKTQEQRALQAQRDAESKGSDLEKEKNAATRMSEDLKAALTHADEKTKEAETALGREQDATLEAAEKRKEAIQKQQMVDYLWRIPGTRERFNAFLSRLEPDRLDDLVTEMQKTSFKPNPALSLDRAGIAIFGYDPVAYFTEGRPVQGLPEHFGLWNGGIWLFANDENRRMFLQEPEHYAPMYGGFCAFCVLSGHKYHSDPTNWAVHEGRLYLHAEQSYRETWIKSPDPYIQTANEKWTALSGAAVEPATNLAASDQILERMTPSGQKLLEARRLLKRERWEDAVPVLEDAIKLNPASVEGLSLAENVYHERLFRFARAFELNTARVQLGEGEDDYVEKHLTNGRFAECATRALQRHEQAEKRLQIVMTTLRFACLAGEQKTQDSFMAGQVLRKEVAGLEKGGWIFSGSKHFVAHSPAFAPNTVHWLHLFDAIEQGDVQTALQSIDTLGVPK